MELVCVGLKRKPTMLSNLKLRNCSRRLIGLPDPDGHPDLYRHARRRQAATATSTSPSLLYQSQNSPVIKRSFVLHEWRGRTHRLSGSVLSPLNADETRAVIGHEMACITISGRWKTESLQVIDRTMQATAGDHRSAPSLLQKALDGTVYTRRFSRTVDPLRRGERYSFGGRRPGQDRYRPRRT